MTLAKDYGQDLEWPLCAHLLIMMANV